MAQYEVFKIWYANSLGLNAFTSADLGLRIENTSAPLGEEIQLIYVIPSMFAKRQTDVSNALAVDPTSPDTGTAGSNVTIRFTQNRTVTPTVPVLAKLLAIFYKLQSDDNFEKGRIGLETSDNPELDCLPVALAGYKLISFKQEPNQDKPALLTYEVVLKFLGDNTKLGTRS
jgi:hypothetical protein